MTYDRRIKIILLSMVVLVLGAFLFIVSQGVQNKERQLHILEVSIKQEKQRLRVLNAEWAYLNNPARLEKLVHSYLDMKQVVRMRNDLSKFSDIVMVSPPAPKPDISQKFIKKVSFQHTPFVVDASKVQGQSAYGQDFTGLLEGLTE